MDANIIDSRIVNVLKNQHTHQTKYSIQPTRILEIRCFQQLYCQLNLNISKSITENMYYIIVYITRNTLKLSLEHIITVSELKNPGQR